MTHSPGPWTSLQDEDCILDANGHHIICFGHDYDQYGGFSASLPRQQDQMKKEIAVIEANRELVRMAPTMLEDILKLREELEFWVSNHSCCPIMEDGGRNILTDTEHYEEYR